MNLWRELSYARRVSKVTHTLSARWLSTSKPTLSFSANTNGPLSELRRSLEKSLKKGEYQAATEAFRKHMTSTNLHNQSRFKTFESAASLFLKYGETNAAKAVHTRLKSEGFLPSVRLRASMLILHGFHKQRPTGSVLAAVHDAVLLPNFEESTLRYLLTVIYVNLPCSPELIEGVIDAFICTRPAGYELSKETRSYLAHLHTRLGSVELATKWRPLFAGGVERTLSQDRTRLLALAEQYPDSKSIILAAILRLDKNVKEHDRILYNSLIQNFLKKQQYQRAFQVYQLMLNSERSISPNATTFTRLFDAWSIMSEPRTFRTRKHKQPLDAPSPRELFRTMMQQHRLSTSNDPGEHSPAVTVYALIAALRTFVKKEDYAAAFVALRSFRLCNYKVPVEVYITIIEGLIHRIHNELRFEAASGHILWAHRFLGRDHVSTSPNDSHILVEGILNLGLQPTLSFDPVPLPSIPQLSAFLQFSGPPESRKAAVKSMLELTRTPYRVPGPLVIIGMLKAWDDQWDVTPLERILRRAILATYAKLFMPPAKAVSREIAEAKRDMVYVGKGSLSSDGGGGSEGACG